MGIVDTLFGSRFWLEWEERFREHNERYITPNEPEVVTATNKVKFNNTMSDTEKSNKAWGWVYENINYDLSKKWKTPKETLRSGRGDCEDVTFLLASMFPLMGIDGSKIEIGELIFPDSRKEYHTWNVVDGNVIDATGSVSSVSMLSYKPIKSFTIRGV